MIHELKIEPKYYCRVADGTKTFEVRDNDRGFQPGDTVILREFDHKAINPTSDAPLGYTLSPPLEFKIGYMYPMGSSQVVFSLLPIAKAPKASRKK